MCLLGVVVALAPVRGWGGRLTRVLRTCAWIGTPLLVLRAVASLVQVSYELVVGRLTL